MNALRGPLLALAMVAALTHSTATRAQSLAESDAERWQWRTTIYGWFPNLDAKSNVALPNGDTIHVETSPDRYLRNLQFAFMGTLEARKGPWSVIGDVVYVDFGKSNANVTSISAPGGPMSLPVPADVRSDLQGFVGELAAGYAVAQSTAGHVDVIGGARYLRLRAGVDATLAAAVPGVPPQLNVERTKDFVDAIVGLRGAAELPERWFVPFEVDAGGGSARFTWQAFAGVGYRFGWGDAMVGYRRLAYDFKQSAPVSTLAFGGPIVGLAFRF